MKTFSEVRAHAGEVLAAAAPFVTDGTSETPVVMVDDGHTTAREDKALLDVGYYVSIYPFLDGDTVAQGAGMGTVDACFPVRVAVNPAGSKNVETLVENVNAALLGYAPTNPADRYKLGQKPFVVDTTDPGEFAYVLFFIKRCAL